MSRRTYSIDDVKAVILIGSRDFGRCPTATRLNRALWPLAGKPVLQRLIEQISNQGVRRFVLCCENYAAQTRQKLQLPSYLDVRFIEETMPRGTAGCIRDAAEPGRDELLFVFGACMTAPPDLSDLIEAHRQGTAEMTIFFNPPRGAESPQQDAQLYICEPSILESIPPKGYFDIKESLVPELVARQKAIYGATLNSPCGNYKNWEQYLQAVGDYLHRIQADSVIPDGFNRLKDSEVWVAERVEIAEEVRFLGPTMIGADTRIASGAVIVGPTMIEQNVSIGDNACLEESVLWDGAVVADESQIRRCLVDEEQIIPSAVRLEGELIPKPQRLFAGFLGNIRRRFSPSAIQSDAAITLDSLWQRPRLRWMLPAAWLLLLGAIIAAYWRPTLNDLWRIWLQSDEYSSGLLVPLLAGYALWVRRKRFADCTLKPALGGLVLLAAAQGLRLFGLYFMFASAERLAFVLSMGAAVLLVFGWAAFRRFLPVFLFLFLMLPLPNRIETLITLPLQEWATASAVFCLEVVGYNPIRQGNVIQIGDTLVAVAEACNGLRMLTAFFVISGFVVLISNRKRWEKAVLLFSTIPIALLCNTIRLTLTSIAFTIIKSENWEVFFHDFGGIMMMPLAIAMIVIQLWILKQLFYPPEKTEQQVVFSRNTKT